MTAHGPALPVPSSSHRAPFQATGLLLAILLAPVPASAQSAEVMGERVERIEQELQILQSQMGGGTAGGGVNSANQEVRLQEFDSRLRALTGQVEELSFQVRQAAERLDKLVADVDFRLRELELRGGMAPMTAGGTAETMGAAQPSMTQPTMTQPALAPQPTQGGTGQPQTLGTLSGSELQSAQSGAAPAPAQPAAAPAGAETAAAGGTVQLPAGTPEQQYEFAFGLLRQANYKDAEVALKAFVAQNPDDRLAGNALYWLGETYYVRGDFANAAVTFAEGYQKYPKSSKAADNLLKLGMALAQLGQKPDACKTFAQLQKEFPSAPANLKERAQRESQRAGCS